MISRGDPGCEPFPTSCRTRRRQGLCTPWPPRYRAIRADHAQRRKTVFTKTFFAYRTPVLIQHPYPFAKDSARFHAAIGVHLDFEAEPPVHLPALLRREVIKPLRRHPGVGFKQSISVPLKLFYDLLPAPDSGQLLL